MFMNNLQRFKGKCANNINIYFVIIIKIADIYIYNIVIILILPIYLYLICLRDIYKSPVLKKI